MTRPLSEVTANVAACPFRKRVSHAAIFDCCLACTMAVCNPKAAGCKVRELVAERQKALYWKRPAKFRRAAKRYYTANKPQVIQSHRNYRKAEPDLARQVQRMAYVGKLEAHRAAARARYERSRDPSKPRRSSAYNGIPLVRPQHSKRA